MDAIDLSLINYPCSTHWQRYDSPTVLRRQGRGFLERTCKSDSLNPEQDTPSNLELEILVESYGGVCVLSADQTLLLFNDYHWATRCQQLLSKRGVPTLRFGCHIQLPGPW